MALPKTSTLEQGFTLIEIIVVMAMLAMIGSLTLIASLQSFYSSSFRDERDAIVTTLFKARAQAVNNICLGAAGACTDGRPHGVHFAAGVYTIFQGASYATRDTIADQTFTPSYSISLAPGSFSDVVFEQLSGDATTSPMGVWTLNLQDSTSKTSTITLNSEGQIIWTN